MTKPDTLPLPGQAGALIDATGDSWSDVADGDLSPPTAQSIPLLALSRKIDGGFVDSDTGEKSTELDFVWLAKGSTRAYWSEPFGKGDKAPTCSSADGITPLPHSTEVQSPACATCPHSRWAGVESPACKDSIEAMVFLPDPLGYGTLARLRLGGMAIGPSQTFWDSFSARMPRRPPIAYVSHVALTPTETPNGTFLVPAYRRVKELTRAEAQPLIDERDRRIAEWQSVTASEVAAGDTRESATPGPTHATPSADGTYDMGEDEPF